MHDRQLAWQEPTTEGHLPRPERIWIAWAALFCAGWPVLAWVIASFHERGDWRPHAVALVAAGALIARSTERRHSRMESVRWTGPACFVARYALTLLVGPSTLQAAAWLLALASLFYATRWRARDCFWIAAFLLLALPTVSHLKFLLSYPLRRLVAISVASLLRFAGQSVSAQGAVLEGADALVVVDAPCSGIRMLWTCLLLAAVVGSMCQLKALRGTGLLLGAAIAALLANILRTLLLYQVEVYDELAALPDWAHSGIGLVTFASAALGIVALGSHLGRSRACVRS